MCCFCSFFPKLKLVDVIQLFKMLLEIRIHFHFEFQKFIEMLIDWYFFF